MAHLNEQRCQMPERSQFLNGEDLILMWPEAITKVSQLQHTRNMPDRVRMHLLIFLNSFTHMLYVYSAEDLESEWLKCKESNKDYWLYPKL